MSIETPTDKPYQPSFSHSDSCERYYADEADTETACTCGADKAQAWLNALTTALDKITAAFDDEVAMHGGTRPLEDAATLTAAIELARDAKWLIGA